MGYLDKTTKAHVTLISIEVADLFSRFKATGSSPKTLTAAFILSVVLMFLWMSDGRRGYPECLPDGGVKDAKAVKAWVIDYTHHRLASGPVLGWPSKEDVSKLKLSDLRDISGQLLYADFGFALLYSVEIGAFQWEVVLTGEEKCKFRLRWFRPTESSEK